MALRPRIRYPAQTDTDVDYPHGKARNAGSYQDGTGTPLEKDWVNDLFGFEQALLVAANITPSDNSDTATVSQYLDAILQVAALRFALYSWNVTSIAANTPFPLTLVDERGGFTLDGGGSHDIKAPATGRHLVVTSGDLRCSYASGQINVTLVAQNPSNVSYGFGSSATRFSASATDSLSLTVVAPWAVDALADPDFDVRLVAQGSVAGQTFTGNGHIFILKL